MPNTTLSGLPAQRQRVVVSAPVTDDTRNAMRERLARSGLVLVDNPRGASILDGEALKRALVGAHGLIVGPGDITESVIDVASDLRVISKFGVGVESIDVEAATRHGVAVTYTPGANAASVADLCLTLMLGLARHLPKATAEVKSGGRERIVGAELAEKTLGLIGVGSIGRAVALRAQAFGMRVIARAPTSGQGFAEAHDVQTASLEEVLRQSEFLSLHVPLTDETRNLIGSAELALLPRGAFVINTARGALLDEAALETALRSGHLAGAGLDVLVDESGYTSPLLQMDSVIATPHIGGATHEALERTAMGAVDNLVMVLQGQSSRSVVNPSVVSLARHAE